jgi:hypothetical protein
MYIPKLLKRLRRSIAALLLVCVAASCTANTSAPAPVEDDDPSEIYMAHLKSIAGALSDDDIDSVMLLLRDELTDEIFRSYRGSMPGGSTDFNGMWMSYYGFSYPNQLSSVSVYPGFPFGEFPVDGGGIQKSAILYGDATCVYVGSYENGVANGDFTIHRSYNYSYNYDSYAFQIITLEVEDGFVSQTQAKIETVTYGEAARVEYTEKYAGREFPVTWDGFTSALLSAFWNL